MNNAILYALLFFSVSGVIALWVNIWIIHKRVETLWELLMRCLAELYQQVAADHTQDACTPLDTMIKATRETVSRVEGREDNASKTDGL